MLSANSRARESRAALGSFARRHPRLCRLRSFAVSAGNEAARAGRFHESLGRHLFFAVAAADYVDRSARARVFAGTSREMVVHSAGATDWLPCSEGLDQERGRW